MELKSFYKSKQWEKLIEQLKIERINDEGLLLCEHCGKPIVKKYDCIGHHKIELTDDNVNDYEVSLNPNNIMLIHFRCHNIIHQRYEGFKQKVYLVYGSPCSGKTTFVDSVATADDLIIDIDRIWECLSINDRYHKPNRLKSNVFGVRDCLIEQVKTRNGMWKNCYIVGTYPLRTDRKRLCELLNAEPIFIDETKAVCISRAMNDEWKKYIDDWFEDYVE